MIALNYFCSNAKKISNKIDYFTGFYFGGKLSKQNLLTISNNLPLDGVCELMCHPGLTDDSTNFSHRNYRQVEKMLALVDREVAGVLIRKI